MTKTFNVEQDAAVTKARDYLARMPEGTQFSEIVANLLTVIDDLVDDVNGYEERTRFAFAQECWSKEVMYEYIQQQSPTYVGERYKPCE